MRRQNRYPNPGAAADGGVVVARTLESKGNEGLDDVKREYVDLVEAGIIDPAKVVRVALENAASVASVLLLAKATMTEIPEPHDMPNAAPQMGR